MTNIEYVREGVRLVVYASEEGESAAACVYLASESTEKDQKWIVANINDNSGVVPDDVETYNTFDDARKVVEVFVLKSVRAAVFRKRKKEEYERASENAIAQIDAFINERQNTKRHGN